VKEALMKKRYGVPAALLVFLVASMGIAAASAAYYYYHETSYEVRQFITPSVSSSDLGTLYADVDGNKVHWGPKDKGDYKTWEAETVNLSLLNKNTLTNEFTAFSVKTYFDVDGDLGTKDDQYSAAVDFNTTSNTIDVPKSSGDVFIEINGTLKTDIGANEVVRKNLRVLELKFTV